MKNTKKIVFRKPWSMSDKPNTYGIYFRGSRTLYVNTSALDAKIIVIKK